MKTSSIKEHLLCPHCKSSISTLDKFCPHCGSEFEHLNSPSPENNKILVHCRTCQGLAESDDQFCPHCGAAMNGTQTPDNGVGWIVYALLGILGLVLLIGF